MPANRFNGHTDYGIGIGLRSPHYHHILTRKPVVDWFEIISENFMIDGGRPLRILDQILEQYKVVQHGVSMYFGSAERPNREHLRRLKTLVQRTKTPWLSDHLCWGSVDGRYTHDLLPMPYTFEAARITAQKIRAVRDFVEIPVAVENVSSYAEFHVSEMTGQRIPELKVAERADFRHPAGRKRDLRFVAESAASIRSLTSIASPRNASRKSTSPAIRNIASTFSIRTITRSLIRCGNSTRAPSNASATPPPSSNGTTAFRRSRKSTTKP